MKVNPRNLTMWNRILSRSDFIYNGRFIPLNADLIERDSSFLILSLFLEQATGIEPATNAWEAFVLPLNYAYINKKTTRSLFTCCLLNWSGKRDSDPRHLPWQGSALPLSYSRRDMVGVIGLEPMTLCL